MRDGTSRDHGDHRRTLVSDVVVVAAVVRERPGPGNRAHGEDRALHYEHFFGWRANFDSVLSHKFRDGDEAGDFPR